jgi:hypothetical protein
MRDGTILRADVYRPAGDGRHPVLLQRCAYNKGAIQPPPVTPVGPGLLDPIRAASNGYAVVIQDERGRYESEGDFRVFLDSGDDGYDSVEWAAAQPWANGRVGLYGISYVGAVQWLAAVKAPPHLVCIFPGMTASSFFRNWTYRSGVLELAFCKSWALTFLSFGSVQRLPEGERAAALGRLVEGVGDMGAVFGRLPVADFPEVAPMFPSYDDWMEHPTYDSYWRDLDTEARYDKVTVPVHHMAGWYDVFLDGTLQNFAGMRSRGGSELARANQRLTLGPWIHWAPPFPTRSGDVEFGAAASIDWDSVQLRWFDYWLKGIDDGIMSEPPVRLFVMGANAWRDEHEWPLERTSWTEYFFRGAGDANTRHGDGRLALEMPPDDEASDTYVYDPWDPTPTRGGCMCCWPIDTPAGAFDQGQIEERRDVLVFSTYQLDTPIEVTGPVRVVLYASTSARDTDFTAKLVDVHPDGFAQNLCEGIVRARYRESTTDPTFVEPDEIMELEIDLWATSNLFKAGHRIRVEIASASFPKYARNFNTEEDPLRATTGGLARQRIYHDALRPSRIILPIIPVSESA